jgi:hypothetical protein
MTRTEALGYVLALAASYDDTKHSEATVARARADAMTRTKAIARALMN